ncbi:hypothetical protein MCBRY_002782 [Methylocystis bryophila]|uniref:Uncharacterized protein n=1 Tax=Methylocystis bryophila TaxID=655015 RepID=A0A1W6MRA2_9HYPH|nr:hypothetical protein B1812_02485 [Methylocystis bryophila]
MAGLVPAIHAETMKSSAKFRAKLPLSFAFKNCARARPRRPHVRRFPTMPQLTGVGGRDKPGHDVVGNLRDWRMP